MTIVKQALETEGCMPAVYRLSPNAVELSLYYGEQYSPRIGGVSLDNTNQESRLSFLRLVI